MHLSVGLVKFVQNLYEKAGFGFFSPQFKYFSLVLLNPK